MEILHRKHAWIGIKWILICLNNTAELVNIHVGGFSLKETVVFYSVPSL